MRRMVLSSKQKNIAAAIILFIATAAFANWGADEAKAYWQFYVITPLIVYYCMFAIISFLHDAFLPKRAFGKIVTMGLYVFIWLDVIVFILREYWSGNTKSVRTLLTEVGLH